jgi:hypothetical protein
MPGRLPPARAIGVVVLALLGGPAAATAPGQPGKASPEIAEGPLPCLEAPGHRHCLRRCTPANLILLPCMAVGAQAMPACREREVGLWVETCRRRFC